MDEKINGVYVVAIDPDITGHENVAFTFRDESDADDVVALLCAHGVDSWVTWEPLAYGLEDEVLLDYLAERVDLDVAGVKTDLTAIATEGRV